MNEPTAIIHIEELNEGLDDRTLLFRWYGPENGIVPVCKALMNEMPDLMEQMPWPLELIRSEGDMSYWRRKDD